LKNELFESEWVDKSFFTLKPCRTPPDACGVNGQQSLANPSVPFDNLAGAGRKKVYSSSGERSWRPWAFEGSVNFSVKPPVLVDSHCHLSFPELGRDRSAVLQRAAEAGVGRFLTVATCPENWPSVLEISRAEAPVYATLGIHPTEVVPHHLVGLAQDLVDQASQNPKVVAFGETGLDFYHTPCDRATQIASFSQHIQAAVAADLPLVIHTREAEEATFQLLEEAVRQAPLRGVIHCFTGTRPFAEQMLNLGFYLSFAGIVTFKNAAALQEIAAFVPLDRLLVETDAPYLAPHPHRGKTNEPAFVVHTAQKIADLKGVSLCQVAQQTTQNFFTLFSRVPQA